MFTLSERQTNHSFLSIKISVSEACRNFSLLIRKINRDLACSTNKILNAKFY